MTTTTGKVTVTITVDHQGNIDLQVENFTGPTWALVGILEQVKHSLAARAQPGNAAIRPRLAIVNGPLPFTPLT